MVQTISGMTQGINMYFHIFIENRLKIALFNLHPVIPYYTPTPIKMPPNK